MRFTVMYYYGLLKLVCHYQLFFKSVKLNFSRRKVIVVIEPDFAHGNAFFFVQKVVNNLKVFCTHALCLVRMHSCRSKNKRVLCRKIYRGYACFEVAAAVDYAADSAFKKSFEYVIAVFVKTLVVVVRV